jgi:hypothetical protein
MNKFSLGMVVSTPGALEAIPRWDIITALQKHKTGDWGCVSKSDWDANEEALIEGDRLFSVYKSKGDNKFYIITEADRSATTILLPSEY